MTNKPHSGKIVVDWYSEKNSQKDSVKISVRFLTNEVRVDALDIKVFSRKCVSFNECSITENKGILVTELKRKILEKAVIYDKEIKSVQKKRRKVPEVKRWKNKDKKKKKK